jgi:hypothetical protein
MKRRELLGSMAICVSVAGCSGGETNDENSEQEEFDRDVLDSLLTSEELPIDATTIRTSDGDVTASGVVADRSRDLKYSDGKRMVFGMILFESPADASSFLETRRTEFEQEDLEVTNRDLGDEANAVVSGEGDALDVRVANTVIFVGAEQAGLTTLEAIVEEQLSEIR